MDLFEYQARDMFDAHDVPVQKQLSLSEAAASPQIMARGLIANVEDQRHVRFPVLRDGEPMGDVRRLAPALGEHTREVLGEFGVASEVIDDLAGTAIRGENVS